MKNPFAFTLLLPSIVVSLFLLEYFQLDAFPWLYIFLFIIFSLVALIEIKLKHGAVSKKTIKAFFNTPIKNSGLMNEEVIDKSPKVSVGVGALIILGGSILVLVILALAFN